MLDVGGFTFLNLLLAFVAGIGSIATVFGVVWTASKSRDEKLLKTAESRALVDSRITALEKALAQLLAKIESVDNDRSESFQKLLRKIEEISTSVHAMDKSMEARFATIDEKISSRRGE